LAAALAADLGVSFVRVQAPWENLLQALDRGDCDVVLNGFEPTADRLPLARFTRAYYLFTQQLVARKDAGIGSLEDCRERRVGCLGQSQSHAVLLATEGVQPIVYDESLRSFLEVDNGRNAAVLADLPIAQALLPKFASLQLAGEPFAPSPYAMAVRKGEDDLRLALDASLLRLLANGELRRIYEKWGMWTAAQEGLRHAAAPASGDGAAAEFAFGSATGLLLTAALRTVGISVAAFALAVGLGLCLALLRLYGPRPLRYFAIAYVEVFRGTPVLVQLLFLYYGLGQWPSLQMPAWLVGVIGLGLNYAAYEAEVYRGAIAAIPRGQTESALALGLSGGQCLRFVLLPQALRLSLPASTNDFVALFKDSAVVMVISVVELGKQYQMLASSSGRFLSLGVLTCGMYLAMSLPLAFLARRFERSLDGDRA
ncbi:MAG: ABC transporter substrate-binding protein/permease, partial [Planctomycetota bacterium]